MKRFISFSEKFASALLILALILGGMNVPATVWAAEDSGDEVVVIEDDTAATVNADTEAETDIGNLNKWLAEKLGKDPATVSKWCTNSAQPNLENLMEIARCLEVDVNELLRM